MPADISKLTSALTKMKKLFVANPTRAVRSKSFITEFQNYCAAELRALNLATNGLTIEIERKIEVGRGKVEADVGIFNAGGAPQLIIDVRSQMSSLGKNFNNYIRMKAGEVESIHERYPKCVIGLIYIHPTGDLQTRRRINPVGSFNYISAAKQLSSLSGRISTDDSLSVYERVAYCVIDFNQDPPRLSNTVPTEVGLRLNDFFDKLAEVLQSR